MYHLDPRSSHQDTSRPKKWHNGPTQLEFITTSSIPKAAQSAAAPTLDVPLMDLARAASTPARW